MDGLTDDVHRAFQGRRSGQVSFEIYLLLPEPWGHCVD